MSGAIASLFDAFGDAALSGIYGDAVLTLGDIAFTDFSVPSRMNYGGKQTLVVHKFPGGARTIDAMGPDPNPITWSGILLGVGAAATRQAIEAMRDAGQVVDLAWGENAYSVLVEECTFDGQDGSTGPVRIDYRITCTVQPNIVADDGGDDVNYGTGDTPDTSSAAQDSGQSKLTKARKAGGSLPVPPIPPASAGGSSGYGDFLGSGSTATV